MPNTWWDLLDVGTLLAEILHRIDREMRSERADSERDEARSDKRRRWGRKRLLKAPKRRKGKS